MRLLYIGIAFFIESCNSVDTDKSASTPSNTPNGELIISERIDEPANVRDTINGKILFNLNDNEKMKKALVRAFNKFINSVIKYKNQLQVNPFGDIKHILFD